MTGKNHLVTGYASAFCIYTALEALSIFGATKPVFNMAARFSDSLVSKMFGFTPHLFLTLGLSLLALGFGSLLPDIDSPNSLLGRYFYLPIEHRSWTHSLYFVLAFVVLGLVHPFFLWVALGVFLHIFWDSLSVGGIAWLRPESGYLKYPNGGKVKRGHKNKLYRVGTRSETFVVLLVLVLTLFVAYQGVKHDLYWMWRVAWRAL